MKAWMIYNEEAKKKNERYIQFHIEEGKKRKIEFFIYCIEKLTMGVKQGEPYLMYESEILEKPDFVICRTIDPLLTAQLEQMEIPVFNHSKVAEICNNKAKTYQYVSQLRIPMIDTIFCKNHELSRRLEEAIEGKPMVIKAVAGHGGSQVFLYQKGSKEEQAQKEAILSGIGHEDFVMQPLTGKRHQDMRVYVIGNEIVAAVLRTAREGFKSNFSLGGDVRLYELSQEERMLVNRIIGLFDFGLVGIDFLIGDSGELIFNEIEDVVGARMLYQTREINLVGKYLDHILHKLG